MFRQTNILFFFLLIFSYNSVKFFELFEKMHEKSHNIANIADKNNNLASTSSVKSNNFLKSGIKQESYSLLQTKTETNTQTNTYTNTQTTTQTNTQTNIQSNNNNIKDLSEKDNYEFERNLAMAELAI